MTPEDQKKEFIHNEILTSAINAAFQRGKVYPDKELLNKLNREDKKKYDETCKEFKKYLKGKVDWNLIADPENIENSIKILCKKITQDWGDKGILKDNEFRIGTAQKLINLYLKFRWCLGWSSKPIHCPFDNQVIAELQKNVNSDVKINIKNISWTTMGSKEKGGAIPGIMDYQNLVKAAKIVSKNKGYKSIAEWELQLWNGTFRS